jgi:plastocyanin
MRATARALLVGVIATLLAGTVLAGLAIATGVFPVAATPHAVPDRILAFASTRSIARHARKDPNPLANDPAASRRGLEHFAHMCVACHGAPGVDAEEFAAGLHPPAPDLASREVQSFTDGMLYETVANGIGSTGMPSFGKTHEPADLWSIVAFVRHLPSLTPEEKATLQRAASPGEHAHGAHGDAHAAATAPAEASPAPAGQRVHRVSIASFKFDPPALTVRVGDAVEWKNDDFAAHTATADDKSFDTGRIDGGATKRVVARRKGSFPYFCRYHLAMKGVLTVE